MSKDGQQAPHTPNGGSSRLGDMNGSTTVLMKLFLISWPVFLTAFLGTVGAAALWASEIHTKVQLNSTLGASLEKKLTEAIQAHDSDRHAHE